MNKEKKQIDKQKDYFSMAEVAMLYGVSKQTIRNYCENEVITPTKIGGTVRIHRSELIRLGIKLGD